MAEVKTTLVPEQAAASVAARVKTVVSCEAWIKDVVKRYDGLKTFEAELQKHGALDVVRQIMKKG